MDVPSVRCRIVRWVDDEPIPGWVEARLTDAHGREQTFFDKPPIFERSEEITPAASYPVESGLGCEVISTRDDEVLGSVATVALRFGVDSTEGESTFDVRRDQVTNEKRPPFSLAI